MDFSNEALQISVTYYILFLAHVVVLYRLVEVYFGGHGSFWFIDCSFSELGSFHWVLYIEQADGRRVRAEGLSRRDFCGPYKEVVTGFPSKF